MKPWVWEKATIVLGTDARVARKDACGAWIRWADYGNRTSQWGWEIDHIYPKALGGTDTIDNLQPLQWQNNRTKGDSLSNNYCAIVAQSA
jgi:hypothetical protein